MLIQIAGRNIDLGDALRNRIENGLEDAVTKYFDRATEGNVSMSRDGHLYDVECQVALPSGISLQSRGEANEPYAAFEVALDKLEKRVRRYKRRLRDHHRPDRGPLPAEMANSFVVAPADENESETEVDYDTVEAPAVIAETQTQIKTMTASMAVMQLELMEIPALMFRNAKHGGLNMVYRREDGHIGWVDPSKTD
ncbi:MAG: ribosomal subunit interface protein [Ponticaulis sp.]|nr:ribosomal subunit interface protein [Ponticaulis sp.]|tara:strand:+ start:11320 stop:11907 length:588 start_codon:yes stop_codon:yes gene_type:complete